jgi:glyoxylase-like metal-dependent hydrolase (beta-lactamase superfamily II)
MGLRALFPGVTAIETDTGASPLALYLLHGDRTLLVDSGLRGTPEAAIFPALAAAGMAERLDMLLISHADADHHGGNAGVIARSPPTIVMCHQLDRPRVISKQRHLRERYTDAVAADDTPYGPEIMAWLSDSIGPDTPVDLALQGGELIHLGPGATWEALHVPGHTPGHLALWNAELRVLIGQDALLGGMGAEPDGSVGSPPPYFAVDSYLATLDRVAALGVAHLLGAHFAPIAGADAVAAYLAESARFVAELDQLTFELVSAAGGPLTLAAVCAAVDARMGPSSAAIQWIPPVRAHLERHTAQGRLRELRADGPRTWMI